jgi:hypothetical protein
MPTAKVKRIEAWSFSRYSTYEECPRKAKYKFLDRLKEPGSKAMDRGGDIHLMAEHAVKNTAPKANDFKSLTPALAQNAVRTLRSKKLPMELKNFEEEFNEARKSKAVAELELAFTVNWDPCDWRDWDHAWVRIKIDLLKPPTTKEPVVEIIDHKTGRPRSAYTEQLELYAIGGLLHYPQAEIARARLWFLDEGKIIPEDPKKGVYKRSELPKLQKLWVQRTKPMLNDTVFAPTPGQHCRYCHFRNSNGGPCEF